MQRVPVLSYHHVAHRALPGLEPFTVSPHAFRDQMQWLVTAGHQPVSLDTLVAGLDLPANAVVITFDDGFADLLDDAVPELESRGFPATFFVVAGLMGQSSRWQEGTLGASSPLIGWDDAGSLLRKGFQIGSHSMSHARLPALSADDRWEEIGRSRELLEDGLGSAVLHFAYPYGAVNDAVRADVVSAGYRSACTNRAALARQDDDVFRLPRVSVSGNDSLYDFICRLDSAGAPSSRGVRVGI